MTNLKVLSSLFIGLACSIFFSGVAHAHCDTLDGPVVVAAKKALEKGDATPVLKWVKKEDEAEIKNLFQKTIIVRSKGKEAQELADRYFFETLVRIHRAGEGEPYTGLKPSGNLDFGIAQADKSLETGNVDELVKTITNQAGEGIRKRFSHAMEKKKDADKSIEAGRESVEAYVQFLHYVERLYLDSKTLGEGNHNKHKEANDSGEGGDHQHKHQ